MLSLHESEILCHCILFSLPTYSTETNATMGTIRAKLGRQYDVWQHVVIAEMRQTAFHLTRQARCDDLCDKLVRCEAGSCSSMTSNETERLV